MNGLGGIGGWELVLVAIIVMVVMGPERMVKHAFQLGRWARQVSSYWKEGTSAFREQLRELETEAQVATDLPKLDEIKDLAEEFRLRDDGTTAIMDTTPKSSKSAAPDRHESDSSQSVDAADAGTASYSAWVPPKKPRR